MDLGGENELNVGDNAVPQIERLSKEFNEKTSDQKQIF